MRYTGPKCRLCRREGVKLFLKGEKCEGTKCTLNKRQTIPGQHGRSGKPTEYARQLREKQKAKRIFGLNEKQFYNLFKEASSTKGTATDVYIMRSLELRLDSAVYRSGIVTSRNTARQLVGHGLMLVNGKRVKTPSIQLRVGDVVSLSENTKASPLFAGKKIGKDLSPKWMEVNAKDMSFTVVANPETADFESIIESRYIVEYYTRN